MNDIKKNKLNKFFDALHDDKDSSIEEIRKDIDNAGINMSKIESGVSSLLDDAKRVKKLGWLAEAKKKRSEIDDLFSKKSQEMKSKFKSAKDLVSAIKSGQFGVPLQLKANAFFRNQNFETLSDDDLISFVEDCHLLDALKREDD